MELSIRMFMIPYQYRCYSRYMQKNSSAFQSDDSRNFTSIILRTESFIILVVLFVSGMIFNTKTNAIKLFQNKPE
jgi:hypothetical protein